MTETKPTVIASVINLQEWIRENADSLKPPVNNKTLAVGKDFIVQVVGGPNQRLDYHVDPYEEWFYQLKGNMHVNVITEDGPQTVHIREGETWLLQGDLPHSPQRPEAGSIGLVIERVREQGTLEKFQWYCKNCGSRVHEVELQVNDIVEDLPPVFEDFYNSVEARTCGNCGEVHPGRDGA